MLAFSFDCPSVYFGSSLSANVVIPCLRMHCSPLINSPPPHLLDAWLFLTACIRWRCASVVPAAAFLICLSSVVESPTPGSRMSQIFSSASCTSRVSSVVPSLKQSARGYKRKSGSVTHGKNGCNERSTKKRTNYLDAKVSERCDCPLDSTSDMEVFDT